MSAGSLNFVPTAQSVDPPNQPDTFSDAVLASLSRPIPGFHGGPWGLIKSIILGGFSFGLLPLLVWPSRFRKFVACEQQQLWHLAEWLRLHTGRPRATELRDWTVRENPGTGISTLTTLLAIFAVMAAFEILPHFDLPILYTTGYPLAAPHGGPYSFWLNTLWVPRISRIYLYRQFWGLWTVLISAGFLLNWFQVCRRAGQMAQFTEKFNAIMAEEGIAPVTARGVGIGFSPLWMLAAFAGLCSGAVWAIPMAFAGVVHQRYVRKTSRRTRSEFSQAVRTMLTNRRPPLVVRQPPSFAKAQNWRPACVNSKCRAFLPSGATYCPRCGTRAV
jgi:hypothetical protein